MEKVTTKKLTNVPETMLITVWARAVETQTKNPIIIDQKAVECVEQIDYDFSKFKKSKLSQVGCSIRAKLIDDEAKKFIAENPDCVVIQLGTGLDARFDRLGRPRVTHWYDLDLPESIETREKLLPASEQNSYLPISLFDYSWIDTVTSHSKPILIIVEGVLMYFSPDEVRGFFEKIVEKIPKVTILMDLLPKILVGKAKSHDSLKKVKNAELQWGVQKISEIEAWNPKIHAMQEYFLSDFDQKKFPMIFRILFKIPYFYHRFNQRVARFDIY